MSASKLPLPRRTKVPLPGLMDSQISTTQPLTQHESWSDEESSDEQPSRGSSIPWGRLLSGSDYSRTQELYPREVSISGRDVDVHTIGRNRNCDIIVDDTRVSGFHCRLYRRWEQTPTLSSREFIVYVEDMSSNGTFVNKAKLARHEQHALETGDEIALVSPRRDTAKLSVFIFINLIEKQQAASRSKSERVSSTGLNDRSLTMAASNVNRRIEFDYDIREEIGSGAIGKVYRAVERISGSPWAVKIVPTRQFAMDGRISFDDLLHEARMLRQIAHPAIVSIREVYCSDVAFSIVMQLVRGGDLFTRILNRRVYPEKDAREVMRYLLSALAYLHERSIVHRDVKPENILLRSLSSDVDVLLTDFGLAKAAKAGCKTFCGTPQYLAPEVLSRKSSFQDTSYDGAAADIWSLGVVLFVLLSGMQPAQCDWFLESPWAMISMGGKSLVRQMTVIKPSLRPSAASLLNTPWLMNDSHFDIDVPSESPLLVSEQMHGPYLEGNSQSKRLKTNPLTNHEFR